MLDPHARLRPVVDGPTIARSAQAPLGGGLHATMRAIPVNGATAVLATLAALVTYGVPVVLHQQVSATLATAVGVALTVALTALLVLVDPRLYLLYWVSLVISQNAFAGLWLGSSSTDLPLAVTEAKTFSIVVAAALLAGPLLTVVRDVPLLRIGLVLYSAALGVNLRHLDLIATATLRNFAIPVLTVTVACAIAHGLTRAERDTTLRTLLYTTATWLGSGAIGELAFGTDGWRSFFHADQLAGLNALSEYTVFFGIRFSREGGFLLEPINAGYVAAAVLVITMLQQARDKEFRRTGDWMAISAAALALVAAASKDSILMFFVFAIGMRARKKGWTTRRSLAVALGAAWAATVVYCVMAKGPAYLSALFTDPIGASGGETASIHMAGLMSGFTNSMSNPIGHGIGSGGNFRMLFDPGFTGRVWLATGGESSWGTLAYQAGLSAVIGLGVIVYALSNRFGTDTAIVLTVWAAGAMFTEELFGPIASSLPLICAALLMDTKEQAIRADRRISLLPATSPLLGRP